ncbi:MAG TPA: tripartite tricarboxylate transporter substrate-binding protein [Burkholderiales bacterium]|jgi:tripartite-type tricarboxylate transporter receptor subunit TctC
MRFLAAIAAALPLCAAAQSYPERPISLVVPFAAGGATDALARQFAERMSRNSRQTILVENIAGAGGTVGAARVARAKPDGYIYLVGHLGYMAAAVGLYRQLPYDPVQDFDAVARLPDTPMVLICGRESRVTTIRGLMDFARQNPGKLNIGNAGIGSAGHLVAALFASSIKAEVTHVSYKGNAPALTDILAGQIDCMFDQSNTALPQVRGEKVVALATTAKARLPQMPGVPTLDESGLPGFEAATWYGIYAPKGTPREALHWLLAQFREAMQDAAFSARLVEQGYVLIDPGISGPEALAAHTRSEVSLWKKVIADAGIAPN